MTLNDAKLVFLDVETTGLSPAMGDRIVEIGMTVCRGAQELESLSRLVNPERPIPGDAQAIHGIRDEDVAECPTFGSAADEVCNALRNGWLVGHNIRFDAGFMAMEIATAGMVAQPLGCLDTCQLAGVIWDLPNYQLGTVVDYLGIDGQGRHRAFADARLSRAVFNHVVAELGGWDRVHLSELQALHTWTPAWPDDPRRGLPAILYDALTNGREIPIGYVNGDGQASNRTIRPVACFPAGRYTYIRARCSKAGELRTFRLDRITL